jgi:hypothetical protein
MTYYQILVATALSLWRGRPSRLYVLTDYLDIEPYLAERLESTGIFSSVVFFSERFQITCFYREVEVCTLTKKADIASALHRTFAPLYGQVFSACQPTDICFFFNELQHYYYYIECYFDQLVKVEDGYKSFAQELGVHRLGGKRHILHRIEGAGFPVLKTASPKIKAIIASEADTSIPTAYRSKLFEIDIHSLFGELGSSFADPMLKVFDLDALNVPPRSVLVLTQPLARAGYCSRRVQHELYDKICRQYEPEYTIFLKPHPGDKVDYADLGDRGVQILAKDLPIDLLQFSPITFDIGVTFGSTSLKNASYVRKTVFIMESEPHAVEEVRAAITSFTQPRDPRVTYCIDASGPAEDVSRTLRSLLRQKSASDIDIVIIADEHFRPLQESNTSRVQIVESPTNSTIKDRWLACLSATKSEYLLFTTAGVEYSPQTHREVLRLLRPADYDCLSLGLRQLFRGHEITRRFFRRLPLPTQPFLTENKVFRRNVVLSAVSALPTTDPDISFLLLYLELLSRCRSITATASSFAAFSVSTPLVVNWLGTFERFSFDQQQRAFDYIYDRYCTVVKDLDNDYRSAMVGLVFWLMSWSTQAPDLRRLYDEFLRSDKITSLAAPALSEIRLHSLYSDTDTGGNPSRLSQRVKRAASVIRREGIPRITKRLRSEAFRRRVFAFSFRPDK